MIVCKFINSRPDWAPSSLVYLIGFGAKIDVLELGMAYKVFAPVNENLELVSNSIVGNVIIKHIAGDLLGVEDESGEMWSMVKIVTTDKIAVECKKSGKKEISFIPSGQTVKDETKENKTTADEPSTSNDQASRVAEISSAFLKSLGLKLVPTDDESKDSDRDTKEFLDLIAHKYESDKAYEDFCQRFNCNPDESDDSDEVDNSDETEDKGPEENESTVAAELTTKELIDIVIHRLCHRVNDEVDESDDSVEDNGSDKVDDTHEDESNLLIKVSDDETSDNKPDTQKLNEWQVNVLRKLRTVADAHLAQWGHAPTLMPDYTQLDQDDFDDTFNRLVGILCKSHPSSMYGVMGRGPTRVIQGPRPIDTKALRESVNSVNVKSDSNPWGTHHNVEIRFGRMTTFPEVTQFLKECTEWDPTSPDFRSLKVDGTRCKFTINNKTLHPLITRNSICSYGAGARREAIQAKFVDNPDYRYPSCDDEDEDDDD